MTLKYPLGIQAHFALHGFGMFKIAVSESYQKTPKPNQRTLILRRHFIHKLGRIVTMRPERYIRVSESDYASKLGALEVQYHLDAEDKCPFRLLDFMEGVYAKSGITIRGGRNADGSLLAMRDGKQIYYELVGQSGLIARVCFDPKETYIYDFPGEWIEADIGFYALALYWHSQAFQSFRLHDRLRREGQTYRGATPTPSRALHHSHRL